MEWQYVRAMNSDAAGWSEDGLPEPGFDVAGKEGEEKQPDVIVGK